VQQNTCADQPVRFKLLFSQIDSVKWNFGDPASNGSNTSAEMNPQHLYPGPGTYQVSAVIFRRCKKDTAYKEVRVVTETAIKLPAFIGDTLACKGTKFSMDVSVPGATEYQWDNGLIFPKRVFDTGGKFFVTVYNNCSVDRKEFNLQYLECPCEVWTPNAFTPNRDGLNDHFKPMVQCAVQDYELKIFHRWGGVVFQSKEINEGWTGRHGQSDAPAGVYVWLLKYRNPNTGVERWEKGTVTLIR
jgi:gliding motility-associated-like protein